MLMGCKRPMIQRGWEEFGEMEAPEALPVYEYIEKVEKGRR